MNKEILIETLKDDRANSINRWKRAKLNSEMETHAWAIANYTSKLLDDICNVNKYVKEFMNICINTNKEEKQ